MKVQYIREIVESPQGSTAVSGDAPASISAQHSFAQPATLPALDGIRGIAILLVVLSHCEKYLPASNHWMEALKATLSCGWIGVDLFFALSGFLITRILVDTREASNYFSSFYARRFLRIFPLYYLVLTSVLIGASFIKPYPTALPLAADRKLYFLYLTNWLGLWKGHWGPNVLGHFWSLAIEEQFYLAWPLCIWILRPASLKKIVIVALGVIFLGRLFWLWETGPSVTILLSTATRIDALLAGVLAALIIRDSALLQSLRRGLPLVSATSLGIFIAVLIPLANNLTRMMWFFESVGMPLLALGFGTLILHMAASHGEQSFGQRFLCLRPLRMTGKYSYGIYVYHVPVLGACVFLGLDGWFLRLGHGIWPSFLFVIFMLGVFFLVAMISYECFERHLLALKRYFRPRLLHAGPLPSCTPSEGQLHSVAINQS